MTIEASLQNNEALGAPTPKAPQQTTDSALTLNSPGLRRQDADEKIPDTSVAPDPSPDNAQSAASTPFLSRALPLAALGLDVFPIDARGKEPLYLGFSNKRGKPARLAFSRHATSQPNVMVAKWGGPKHSDCNVGVCFRDANYGADIDSLSKCEEILGRPLDLSEGACVNTSTSDKLHLYFNGALPDWCWTRGAKYETEEVDAKGEKIKRELFSIRCDVRYLVGPGSIHPSGAVYQWADGAPDRLPETNENLLRQLQEISEKLGATASKSVPLEDEEKWPPERFDKLLNTMRDNFERMQFPDYEEREACHGGTNFIFDECLAGEHEQGDNTSQVGVRPDGMLTWHCFHGSHDLRWAEARPLIEARYGVAFDFGDCFKGPEPTIGKQQTAGAKARLRVVRFSEIQTEKIKWMWTGKLAIGHVATFNGDPGAKKSFISLDLAARVSTGRPMPDGQPNPFPPSYVLVLTREDGLADTVKPRFLAAGGDPDKLISLACGVSNETANFKLETQLDDLDKILDGFDGEVRLIIFDPLLDFMKAGQNNEAEVRDVLTKLKQFAERRGLCVIGINHLNKKSDLDAIHRTMGAKGFIGVARLNFLVGKDESGTLHLSSLKNNLWQDDGSLTFRIEDSEITDGHIHISKVGRVVWTGKGQVTADELAAPKGKTAQNRTADWLKSYLKPAGQKKAATDIYKAGKAEGFSEDQIKRALGKVAQHERVGMPATTVWWLPISEEDVPW